jgi:potassium-transporting ATPase potassium-binding subunit
MNFADGLQMLLFLAVVLAAAVPLGWWCYRLLDGSWRIPGEGWLFRLAGVDATAGYSGGRYAGAVLLLNGLGVVVVMALLMLQGMLPGNPQALPGTSWHLAFNTAVSFATNTNWQSYGGE